MSFFARILAEGAIPLSVAFSGGALFANGKLFLLKGVTAVADSPPFEARIQAHFVCLNKGFKGLSQTTTNPMNKTYISYTLLASHP